MAFYKQVAVFYLKNQLSNLEETRFLLVENYKQPKGESRILSFLKNVQGGVPEVTFSVLPTTSDVF